MRHEVSVGIPTKGKPTLYEQIRKGLTIAAQLIITAPLKLPPKVVTGAKYATLLLSLLDALDNDEEKEKEE